MIYYYKWHIYEDGTYVPLKSLIVRVHEAAFYCTYETVAKKIKVAFKTEAPISKCDELYVVTIPLRYECDVESALERFRELVTSVCVYHTSCQANMYCEYGTFQFDRCNYYLSDNEKKTKLWDKFIGSNEEYV